MNGNNYGFIIFLIIAFVLSTTIEARGGGRGGGGRSGGGGGHRSSGSHSSGGGGGFWGSLFGGSKSTSGKSSSVASSPSDWKPPTHTSYNYQHSVNYGNSFGARPPKTSDSNDYMHDYRTSNNFGSRLNKASDSSDFMSGHMVGNLIAHDVASHGFRGNFFNTNPNHREPDFSNNGYVQPRVLILTHNQAESTTIATPTTSTTEMSTNEMLEVLKELNKPFDSNESLHSFLDRMAKIDFSNVWAKTTVETPSTQTTSEVPISSTELLITVPTDNIDDNIVATPSTHTISEITTILTELPGTTTESIAMHSKFTPALLQKHATNEMPTSTTELPGTVTDLIALHGNVISSYPQQEPTAESKDKDMGPHLAIPPNDDLLPSAITSTGDTVPATIESIQEATPVISAPYGLICAPIKYNEINEFGVNVIIERLACYPAAEAVVPLE